MADDWRRYVAPAAFLLAVTIAVILVRSGLRSGSGSPSATATVPVVRTTTGSRTSRGTTTTRTAAARKAFWTVRAGDTFGVIAAKTGVPVATIERLNPKASSTTLFIGEKIRLR